MMRSLSYILSSFVLVVLPTSVSSCSVSGPYVTECNGVGQPTRISTGFQVERNASGWVDWGDGSPLVGFYATNETSSEQPQLIRVNDGYDFQLLFEHVYTEPGTYSVVFEIFVYRNETMLQDNWCISSRTPNFGDQWLLTVKDIGCKEEFSLSGATGLSIWFFLVTTIASFMIF
ncbi:hypothetical protein IV203_037987 [Nitzschia inconspicua]|uniref:Uncharacterized protein n=1 Tax=Nitzschia inconspicua TaxID=303405 RepID=A0A9K3LMW1_9STRA|nr:hypothetical protein IV203_037987 [Nitzschia inconspicua]